MRRLVLLLFVVVAAYWQPALGQSNFNNDMEWLDDFTGAALKIKSRGKLADTVHLEDYKQDIRKLACVDKEILLSLNSLNGVKKWKVGQIILGTPSWNCAGFHDERKPSRGISRIITKIAFPTKMRMSLHTEKMGPLDMIEEAVIQVQYHAGALENIAARRKRAVSNPLSQALDALNITAKLNDIIGWNFDEATNSSSEPLTLTKVVGQRDLRVDWSRGNMSREVLEPLQIACHDCYGASAISYVFRLIVERDGKAPRLIQYTSQFEADTEIKMDLDVSTLREVGVSGSATLVKTPPQQLLRLPVAAVRGADPIMLSIDYTMETKAHFSGYVGSSGQLNTGFVVRGKHTVSSHTTGTSANTPDITSYDWGSTPVPTNGRMDSMVDMSFDIRQEVEFMPSISWEEYDINISLSPPVHMSLSPHMTISTSADGVSRCHGVDLDFTEKVSVERANLLVTAWGSTIWDLFLSGAEEKSDRLISTHLSDACTAEADEAFQVGPPYSMEVVCGQAQGPIARTDSDFNRLRVLKGNGLQFESETGQWCGQPGTACSSCDTELPRSSACAARIMTSRLAAGVSDLALKVKAEWPTKKLLVKHAWTEPTSDHPSGRFGNDSLHYEGRAAVLSLHDLTDVSPAVIDRLGQLAVSTGLDYVRVDANYLIIFVGVKADGTVDHKDRAYREMFQQSMADNDIGQEHLTCAGLVPPLDPGKTWPPIFTTVTEALGTPHGTLNRFVRKQAARLVEYTFSDVTFDHEGHDDQWCGMTTRGCFSTCDPPTRETEPFDWCRTRVMTPRAARALRRLVTLAQGMNFAVAQALVEPSEAYPSVDKNIRTEGRGLVLRTDASTSGRLAALAICAGFDFIHHVSAGEVHVFVKVQDGFQETIVLFNTGPQWEAVASHPSHAREYALPEVLTGDSSLPPLLDGQFSGQRVASVFKAADFMHPDKRYFRLDPLLVQCLEAAQERRRPEFQVVTAYKSRSVAYDNLDLRHPEERWRAMSGQAAELKPVGSKPEHFSQLARVILRECLPSLQIRHRGIGFGCHKDHLYVDVRSLDVGKERDMVQVWEVEDTGYCADVFNIKDQVENGGPVVSSIDIDDVCNSRIPGDLHFLAFQFGESETCDPSLTDDHCRLSRTDREREAAILEERLISAAGHGRISSGDLHDHIQGCLVDHCGGCPGTGEVWDKKVINCARVVHEFLAKAARPFPDLNNTSAFFNTEHAESGVHGLACTKGDSVCVEEVQIYSLIMSILTMRYRPRPTSTIEHLLFGPELNPSPLLEIVEQEMAYRARGLARVYIDHKKDVVALKNTLKVLMMLNKGVTKVEFHVSHLVDQREVLSSIGRKTDFWAGTTCTHDSRFTATPYTVEGILPSRRKRSLEYSRNRNEALKQFQSHDFQWLSKLL